ncbi:helix-turn-helix transcriptional regulator [Streptomyces microflavus]|uniref:helix-turn-helix domain-containing protein n=1 Tax=Streptomyces microflavus TaxID=1919 RepID=UPI00341EA7FE
MTSQPRTPTQVTDPTGLNVAANVRRVRKARGWSTYDLSRVLEKAGRPIAPSAVAKVERGERRVDVGDLTALAAALRVSPSALLFPLRVEGEFEVTGAGRVSASDAWEWADGARPLVIPEGDGGTAMLEYILWSRPRPSSGARLDAATRQWAVTVEGRKALADSLEAAGHEVDRNDDGTLRGVHWKQGD